MASLKRFVELGFLIIQLMSLHVYQRVDGEVINIYSSTKPGTVLANLSTAGWTNYALQSNSFQVVSIDASNGLVRMARQPNCESLPLNPFTMFVERTSIYEPTKRSLSPLTVAIIRQNCVLKFRSRLKCKDIIEIGRAHV